MSDTISKRNAVTRNAAIKLGIFTIISIFVTGLLTAIMGNFGFGSKKEFKAVFQNASMLLAGDEVRVAGISVGEIKAVEIKDRNNALVTFSVKADVPVTDKSRAEIRYLNLVGARYLAVVEGPSGGSRLADGATIPISNTKPALNLTALFSGFQPLFQVLRPNDVNNLSLNLIRLLQGEGGTIRSLMENTAKVTNGIADRDKLIGQTIKNLSQMLGTVDSRRKELSSLLRNMNGWMKNLAKDRNILGGSLENISTLSDELSLLLTQARPHLKYDVAQLRRLMKLLNSASNRVILDKLLRDLPEGMKDQTRLGIYGSWYNYYLCDLTIKIVLPKILPLPQLPTIGLQSTTKRCGGRE